MRSALLAATLLLAPSAVAHAEPLGPRLVEAAEKWLGATYVFGGRDGRRGCRRDGKRVRCRPGIDCQSLLFFAFEEVTGRRWTRFSVMPSQSVKRKELGTPVPGLSGVLYAQLDTRALRPGDVLFFMIEGYNLEADAPLLVRGEQRFGVWHTGMLHSVTPQGPRVIHAKPGAEVAIEALDAIAFDALYVLRP